MVMIMMLMLMLMLMLMRSRRRRRRGRTGPTAIQVARATTKDIDPNSNTAIIMIWVKDGGASKKPSKTFIFNAPDAHYPLLNGLRHVHTQLRCELQGLGLGGLRTSRRLEDHGRGRLRVNLILQK